MIKKRDPDHIAAFKQAREQYLLTNLNISVEDERKRVAEIKKKFKVQSIDPN